MSEWIRWFRLKLILWLWPPHSSFGFCANRSYRTFTVSGVEVNLTLRDTRKPDGYARTELLEMLETVRKHERQQGWRVPDRGRRRACESRV